ncbi:hypothetical protein EVAR_86004_1 [Eumeta japonica]|uniref:Uncharacterized protein n=1 Tax=Eumeta variegata TaxID=151549 RepID=A0A4C1UKL0_EUMVA|nr:hypothetical protein EVAR_86004_1 [Eumeta japonica]
MGPLAVVQRALLLININSAANVVNYIPRGSTGAAIELGTAPLQMRAEGPTGSAKRPGNGALMLEAGGASAPAPRDRHAQGDVPQIRKTRLLCITPLSYLGWLDPYRLPLMVRSPNSKNTALTTFLFQWEDQATRSMDNTSVTA